MQSILFVCTGNIFRSMTAEYALKATLGPEPAYIVSSAGIEAMPQAIAIFVAKRLCQRGIDPTGHHQRRVTAEILAKADLVVAMGHDHRAYLRREFGREAWLFNQICFGTEEPVLDVWEAVGQHNPAAQQAYGAAVVDYICEAMPAFIAKVERFF